MTTPETSNSIERGQFPFPLTRTNEESPFLVWLRNHSMYMVSRGLLDYFDFAAILIRGIVINTLSILPTLLLSALLVSLLYANLLYDWRDQSVLEFSETRLALDGVHTAQQRIRSQADSAGQKADAGDKLRALQQAEHRLAVARQAELALDRAKVPRHFFLSQKSVFADSGWVWWMQNHLGLTPPFLVTPLAFALVLIWIVLFPIIGILIRIAGYNQTLATGSDSSVRSRDRYERTFGALLFVSLAIAVFEALPLAVHFFHQIRKTSSAHGWSWQEYLVGVTVIWSALSAAPKLLTVLGGLPRALAIGLIAVLGLLLPLSVVIMVTDFLVYESVPASTIVGVMGLFVTPPIIYAGLVVVAMVVGAAKKTFAAREYRWLVSLLLAMLAMPVVLSVGLLVIWLLVYELYLSHPSAVPDILLAVERTRGDSLSNYGDLAAYVVLGSALQIWLYCRLAVDINLTSLHGLYRDRLASAFLLGLNNRNQVAIEQDIPLNDLCCFASGSTAPYHLINATLNLGGSKDLSLRDRRSDFFVFSKNYIGGARTGYCRSLSMEQTFPQLGLASAMAISAAAAAPNMGRSSSPLLVAFLTLINVRLGIWVPNPGLLEEAFYKRRVRSVRGSRLQGRVPGFTFDEVFRDELRAIEERWEQLGEKNAGRCLAGCDGPTPRHRLAGIALSGGGIRSATVNLGITQVLHAAGLFEHFDYMSTVSGGGYLGSSISAIMRHKAQPVSALSGTVSVSTGNGGETVVTVTAAQSGAAVSHVFARHAALDVRSGDVVRAGARLLRRSGPCTRSQIAGVIAIGRSPVGEQLVRVTSPQSQESREYRYTRYDVLAVAHGDTVAVGDLLVKKRDSFGDRFRWRVRPSVLLREMTMRLVETFPWVNLSDGGHIENLATIELLRRRCKLIVIGDCEADGSVHFGGMATLMRTARLDLGIQIEINLEPLYLDTQGHNGDHFAIGRIIYPGDSDYGYLLYLKSSYTGDEDDVIREYRMRCPDFPHQSTADQFFDEGQFEAYRSLGQHIAEQAVAALNLKTHGTEGRFDDFVSALAARWAAADKTTRTGAPPAT